MKRILSAIACAVFHKGTAIVYRFAARQAVGLPVLAIGNLTWGGAGKTPTALAFAAGLARTGEHPAIVSRGYKRRLRGTVAVDPARHNAGDVGDEPLMMARRGITVFVDVSRKDGAAQAQNGGATCLLLDDGIQNPRLKADFTLVVVDGGVGIDTGQIVPIRLPLSVLAGEVDAVLLIGDGAPGEAVAAEATRRGLPVFRSAYAAGALIGPEGLQLWPCSRL